MKALYQTVTITLYDWKSQCPIVGDALQTSTGRTYEITEIRGKRHICRVIPHDAELRLGATVHLFCWVPRKPKAQAQ
jgi:uncharacterized protein (UPF0179 family)